MAKPEIECRGGPLDGYSLPFRGIETEYVRFPFGRKHLYKLHRLLPGGKFFPDTPITYEGTLPSPEYPVTYVWHGEL